MIFWRVVSVLLAAIPFDYSPVQGWRRRSRGRRLGGHDHLFKSKSGEKGQVILCREIWRRGKLVVGVALSYLISSSRMVS
jgi:hypothetical protein